MAEKLFSDIFEGPFLSVEKETNQKEGIRYTLWTDWYSVWIDMFKWLVELRKEQEGKLLISYRLLELNKQLLWICKCVYSGAYHTAIRELRFVFESFVQAFYLDKEHPDSEMECKLEIIKEIDKLIGARLIEDTKLKKSEKLKDLYKELSNYIHPSYKELELPIKEGKVDTSITFVYDKILFDKCYVFTNKVIDAIMFILISFESGLVKKIQEDEIMMKFLEETNCEISLDLLNKK